jgi:iron complex outermembrane receptor protein
LNADGVYKLVLSSLPEPVNIAFGLERRQETYTVQQGDKASYEVGPGAQYGLAVGSNGFPGFSDLQAGEWNQISNAAYLDIESNLTKSWIIGAAVRYEDFDTFGSTTNGKISSRYEFTPDFAIRASYSTGFRAPTVGQVNSLSTSQGLDTTTLQLYTTGRISPTNPIAIALGAKPLEPEESKNLSAGLVWNTDIGLSGSIDAYRVDIDNRISSSSTIKLTDAQKAALVAQGLSGASTYTSIYWFTNDYDTRTEGVDLVTTYATNLLGGKFNIIGAYNYNKTSIRGGTLNASATQKRLFEENLPKHNASITANYSNGAFDYQIKGRYYGKWTDSSGNSTGDIFQEFGSIAFIDASVVYNINSHFSVKIAGENILDTYPDKALYQASRGIVYSRNAPYDSYGGQYYVRFSVKH